MERQKWQEGNAVRKGRKGRKEMLFGKAEMAGRKGCKERQKRQKVNAVWKGINDRKERLEGKEEKAGRKG